MAISWFHIHSHGSAMFLMFCHTAANNDAYQQCTHYCKDSFMQHTKILWYCMFLLTAANATTCTPTNNHHKMGCHDGWHVKGFSQQFVDNMAIILTKLKPGLGTCVHLCHVTSKQIRPRTTTNDNISHNTLLQCLLKNGYGVHNGH